MFVKQHEKYGGYVDKSDHTPFYVHLFIPGLVVVFVLCFFIFAFGGNQLIREGLSTKITYTVKSETSPQLFLFAFNINPAYGRYARVTSAFWGQSKDSTVTEADAFRIVKIIDKSSDKYGIFSDSVEESGMTSTDEIGDVSISTSEIWSLNNSLTFHLGNGRNVTLSGFKTTKKAYCYTANVKTDNFNMPVKIYEEHDN